MRALTLSPSHGPVLGGTRMEVLRGLQVTAIGGGSTFGCRILVSAAAANFTVAAQREALRGGIEP